MSVFRLLRGGEPTDLEGFRDVKEEWNGVRVQKERSSTSTSVSLVRRTLSVVGRGKRTLIPQRTQHSEVQNFGPVGVLLVLSTSRVRVLTSVPVRTVSTTSRGKVSRLFPVQP